MRNPVSVNSYESLYSLNKILLRDSRHAETYCRIVYTLCIFVYSEGLNSTVGSSVGLKSLKYLKRIVKCCCSRMK